MGRQAIDFVPCPLQHIPKPALEEFRTIFDDLDGDGRGYLLGETHALR
jgi:hypothetical protein